MRTLSDIRIEYCPDSIHVVLDGNVVSRWGKSKIRQNNFDGAVCYMEDYWEEQWIKELESIVIPDIEKYCKNKNIDFIPTGNSTIIWGG